MEFLITESQLVSIINEGEKSSFTESMKNLHSFTNNIINKVKRKFELNLKLLSTWGTSVAGLVMPLDEYMKTGEFNLDDNQRALILIGIIALLYYDNKTIFRRISERIQKEKIEKEFKVVLNKGVELRAVFIEFLESLELSIKSFSELISYSFLIPIVTDIQKYAQNSENLSDTAEMIGERLLASGVILVGAEILNEVLKRMLKRFK